MMDAPHDSAPGKELERLRHEYAQRQQASNHQDTYSLFNPGHLYMIQQRQRAVLSMLRRENMAPLDDRRILEIGCGAGGVLREFLWYGARPERLHGIEVLDWRIAEAKAMTPHLPLTLANGNALPYADASFDLVMQFTVFSSILDERTQTELAAEMRRVVNPGGLILWYDFWLNPHNAQTRGVRPAEIRRLFPGCSFRFQRITLAPPIARRLSPVSRISCQLLEHLRILNSHYLVAIRPQI